MLQGYCGTLAGELKYKQDSMGRKRHGDVVVLLLPRRERLAASALWSRMPWHLCNPTQLQLSPPCRPDERQLMEIRPGASARICSIMRQSGLCRLQWRHASATVKRRPARAASETSLLSGGECQREASVHWAMQQLPAPVHRGIADPCCRSGSITHDYLCPASSQNIPSRHIPRPPVSRPC